MKAVVNLDIRNSLPNSIDKLQLAASEINKLSFDAPITINICFTVEGFHVYGDIPDFLKDRLNDILDAL